MIRTTVTATATTPGTHRWPGAPKNREYLSHPHRHLFVCSAEVEVGGMDREVEFHDLRDLIVAWLTQFRVGLDDMCLFGAASCEHLCIDLYTYLTDRQIPVVRVSVSEDGENQSTLTKVEAP